MQPESNEPTVGWGFIDKRDISIDALIWLGVEPCQTEEEGKRRAAELQAADPTHEYVAHPYDDPPEHVCVRYD